MLPMSRVRSTPSGLYAYVGGNPISLEDPLGLCSSKPQHCWGTFVFGGSELDVGTGGAFNGYINEYDNVEGNSVGHIYEAWVGGEGGVVGGGKITSAGNVFGGWLGFAGVGLSGVLAGFQIGIATGGGGWGGLYIEGHIAGLGTWGTGGYLRPCE
jgi:hypothetical protein